MKKNCIMSYLVGVVVFFSCVSCVFGGDKMEKEYIVTINGIKMRNNAATALLNNIVKEEKEAVNVVDQSIGKNLDVTIEVLKPKMNIFIDKSKNIANVLELFEILKEQKKSLSRFKYFGPLKDKNVILMKVGNQFCISDTINEINLCINDNNQIIKIVFYPESTVPNYVKEAEPIEE